MPNNLQTSASVRAVILLGEANDSPSEKLDAFDRLLKKHPRSAYYHAARAYCLTILGRHDEAIAACDRAVELNPDLAFAFAVASYVYRNVKDYENALAGANHAIELDPAEPLARTGRAITLARLGRLAEALVECDNAVELDPEGPLAIATRNLVVGLIKQEAIQKGLKQDAEHKAEILAWGEVYKISQEDNDFVAQEYAEPYYAEDMNDAAKIRVATKLLSAVYPAEHVGKALDDLAAKAGRETTARTSEQPRAESRSADIEPARAQASAAAPRTAQELFGIPANKPARRYHRSDGPEFSDSELKNRVLLAAADAVCNDMRTRKNNGDLLKPEDRAAWNKARRFAYHARKIQSEQPTG